MRYTHVRDNKQQSNFGCWADLNYVWPAQLSEKLSMACCSYKTWTSLLLFLVKCHEIIDKHTVQQCCYVKGSNQMRNIQGGFIIKQWKESELGLCGWASIKMPHNVKWSLNYTICNWRSVTFTFLQLIPEYREQFSVYIRTKMWWWRLEKISILRIE